MKHNKLFVLFTLMAALGLAACNNSTPSSSKGSSKSSVAPTSQAEGGEEGGEEGGGDWGGGDWGGGGQEEEETGDLTFDSVTLGKEGNNVIITVAFTDENADATVQKKWAWGISNNGSFIYGAAKDEATFNIDYTLDAEKKGSLKFNLTAAMATVTTPLTISVSPNSSARR